MESQERRVNCPRSHRLENRQSQNWRRNWAAPESCLVSCTLMYWDQCLKVGLWTWVSREVEAEHVGPADLQIWSERSQKLLSSLEGQMAAEEETATCHMEPGPCHSLCVRLSCWVLWTLYIICTAGNPGGQQHSTDPH